MIVKLFLGYIYIYMAYLEKITIGRTIGDFITKVLFQRVSKITLVVV